MQPLSLAVLWDPFFSILIPQKNTGNSKQTSLYAFRIWAKVIKKWTGVKFRLFKYKTKKLSVLAVFLLSFFCGALQVCLTHWRCSSLWLQHKTSTKTSRNRRKAKSIKAGKRVVGHKQMCFRWHSVCGSWWLCEYSLICWPECWLFPRLLGTLGGACTCIWCVCLCVCIYACACTYLTLILTS